MVEHMVWIKFNPGVSPERAHQHMSNLAGLKSKVPSIIDMKIGPNFTDRANGFTHGMIVSLRCQGCLKEYLEHPEHVKVAGALKQDAQVMAMDIDTHRE